MGIGLAFVGGATAQAAVPGISATLLHEGSPVQAGDVLPEGAQLKLRVQYSGSAQPSLAGQTISFELGSNVGNLGLPATNTAVANVASIPNGIAVTFADPWPEDTNQGFFDLDFELKQVNGTGVQDIVWKIGGEESQVTIVVKNDGDAKENVVSGVDKARVSPGDLNSFVQRDTNGNFTGINPSIIGSPVTYKLTLNVPKGETLSDYNIADQITNNYLSIVNGSFTSSVRTWDADGWNQTDTPLTATTTPVAFVPTIGADGRSFAGTVDLVGPAVYTVNYQATVANEADRLALETALRAEFTKKNGAAGNYTVHLDNTATFGPDTTRTDDARISITGNTPGPCITGCGGDKGFQKDADWGAPNYDREFIVAEDGTILNAAGNPEPAKITYSFRANLGEFDSRTPNYELNSNVVLVDALPAAASVIWDTAQPAFIKVAEGTLPLASAGTCPAAGQTEFSNTAAGSYCVSADNKTLMVNLGKDQATNVLIEAQASLSSVAGLAKEGTTPIKDATRYVLPNTAKFHINGNGYNVKRDVYPISLPSDRSNGLNDSTAFDKSAAKHTIVVQPGETATVPYSLVVETKRAQIAVGDIRIVDQINRNTFDVAPDLSNVNMSAKYDGADVTAHLQPTYDPATGELVVEFSDAGKVAVAALPADKKFELVLDLTTFPLTGKQSIDVKNSASLFGTGTEPIYWSDEESEATSFGDEAEIRKRLYDRNSDEWARSVRAAADADGNLAQPVFVYRIDFVGRGSFGSVAIQDVVDNLPASVNFLGFVAEADVATAANPDPSPVTLPHGLKAEYAAGGANGAGSVTLSQASGTFPAGGVATVYFAVEVLDGTAPIVNSIQAGVDATIDPVGPASVDIEKWTVEDNATGPTYDADGKLNNDGYPGDFDTAPGKALPSKTDQEIHFTVSNDGPDNLVDVRVSDRLDSGAGVIQNLTCDFLGDGTLLGTEWAGPMAPGTQFQCVGTLPGLKAGETHANTARVDAVGEVTGIVVNDEDSWNGYAKSYAVGDYTWIDKNKDGKQDANEPVLPGVKVELLDENGNVVATTKTDKNGWYMFDNLDAGTYQVRFTLTPEQAKKYRFTAPNRGDAALDSDAHVGKDVRIGTSKPFVLDDTNTALTKTYDKDFKATEGIDPTWDAGVIELDLSGTGVTPGPKDPGTGKNEGEGGLSKTGGDAQLWLAGGAAALLLAGAVTLILRRQRKEAAAE